MNNVEYDTILKQYPSSVREGLIPVLQEIQNLEGFISKETIVKVAAYFKLPTSKVYGLATFYDEFKFEKEGKYVFKICNGSACHVLGSQNLLKYLEDKLEIKDGETSNDGQFTLKKVDCVGACALAPVVMVNDKYYIHIHEEDIEEIISEYRNL